MRRDTLDTGSSDHLGRHALKRAASLLVAVKFKVIKPVSDLGGIYAFEMHGEGQRFYLVARTTDPMKYQGLEIVSSQLVILAHARRDEVPLLMAMSSGPRDYRTISLPEWRLFHPDKLFHKNEGLNERHGIRFVNWDYRIGRTLQDPRDLPDVWHEMKTAWTKEKEAMPLIPIGLEDFI